MLIDLKREVSDYYRQIKLDQELSYTDLVKESGLGKTQLTNILKHNGKEMSLDRMFEGLWEMGYCININVGDKDEH